MDTMEQTFALIKPDAFQRNLVGRIISRFEEKGLQLVAAKLIHLNDDIISKQYQHLADKPFFPEIRDFMTKSPVLATVWRGADCVETVRRLCGITKAREANPGTIRGDWAMSVMCNLVHASDSRENADFEISLYFSKEEILDYERNMTPFLYSIRERSDE
jgi:nucleoside-diphosphate kinase